MVGVEVTHSQARAAALGRVGGTDPLLGGAEAGLGLGLLLLQEPVDLLVHIQHCRNITEGVQWNLYIVATSLGGGGGGQGSIQLHP